MSDPRTCPMPGCAGQLETSEWGDLACPTCGVAGPEGVIDAIAYNGQQLTAALAEVGRLQGAALTAAEERLRAAGVIEVVFYSKCGPSTRLKRSLDPHDHFGDSLAEAFEKLTGAHVAAPKGTET